ncbi:MAG: alpha/beta fold hydrolase [Chitinophagaceae bacterium]|nr:alpha/beta fold hydrolase [Chitinophagaceae bacterium]
MKNIGKLFLSLLLTHFFASEIYAQEEPIVLKTPTADIQGTLTMPDQKKRIPIVLIISGSGATDRDCNQPNMKSDAFKYLADTLRKSGIASVRFDKRGVGKSLTKDFKEKDLIFDDYAKDIKGWLAMLAKDNRFSKIIVAGHSEGSLLGMIACKNNKKVKGYISIAGPATPTNEKLKEQLASQPQEMKTMLYAMIDTLKNGDTLHNVPKSLYVLFRPSVQPYLISWFKYNPQTEIKALNMPVLIIQGSTDIQVSVKDAELLAAAKPSSKKVIIQNMNHPLKDCDTVDQTKNFAIYNKPELPLNATFVKEMIGFIKGIK